MVKFSVIIPVRQINDFLVENISYLRKLKYSDFEVLIIVDEEEKYDFGGDSRFSVIPSGSVSPGDKRNLGAKKSRGEILVFLDDDAYPGRAWLKKAERIFSKKYIYALGAPAVTPKDSGFLEKVSGRMLESPLVSGFTNYRHMPKKRRLVDDYPSVNLFVKKDAFVKVGGFDTNFWPGEDTKLCLDLVSTFNRKFLYDPKPVVYHHRRDVFLPYLKQISRYGRHRGQFAKIFPETSRIFSYFVPLIFVLFLFFGLILSFIHPIAQGVFKKVMSLYLFLIVFESTRVMFKDKSIKAGLYFAAGVFLTHITYGVNFLIGLVKKPKLVLRKVDKTSGKYIGG